MTEHTTVAANLKTDTSRWHHIVITGRDIYIDGKLNSQKFDLRRRPDRWISKYARYLLPDK